MEFATIVTVKQVCFAALIRSLQLYMEQDYCVCAPQPGLPGITEQQACPPDCERCMWCIGRKALADVGHTVDD